MAGLDPAIHQTKNLFGAQTRAGWVAASVGGHDGIEKCARRKSNTQRAKLTGLVQSRRISCRQPEKLVFRESNVKVTLSLSQRSVDFFKRAAKKQHVPYQRMIRALVDAYAERADD